MTSHLRHFDTDTTVASLKKPDLNLELLESLNRINTYNPPVHTCSTGWSPSGLYRGPTSIAYLFCRLSSHYPDLRFKSQSLLEWAEDYLRLSPCAIQGKVSGKAVDPAHCGIANETLAYLAVNSLITSDESLVHQLCKFEGSVNGDAENASNEWLYGRAGYLYFLRVCRTHSDFANNQSVTKQLDHTITKTVHKIMSTPLPWTWHGKQYLGAAHGNIGIITQIILSLDAISTPLDDNTAKQLESLLAKLLAMQFPSGNFPSSADHLGHQPSSTDELVQFCHGAPGFITSLECIKHLLSQPLQQETQAALERAQQDTFQRGLLTKPPSLCHGIAGNALSFTDANDQRLEKFLAAMTTEVIESMAKAKPEKGVEKGWMEDAGHSDRFASLFTGEAGRALVWAVADRKLARRVIGFNDV